MRSEFFGHLAVRGQAVSFRLLAKLGLHVLPRDRKLRENFEKNRRIFDRVRDMMNVDSHLGYVSQNKTRVSTEGFWRTPDNPAVPHERWNEYKSLLNQINVEAVSHVEDTITMRMSAFGLSSKGIVWSPAHRVVVTSLEGFPLPKEMHAHIILHEPWHIYYGWDV